MKRLLCIFLITVAVALCADTKPKPAEPTPLTPEEKVQILMMQRDYHLLKTQMSQLEERRGEVLKNLNELYNRLTTMHKAEGLVLNFNTLAWEKPANPAAETAQEKK